ncbi:ATP-binding cassette domain-containing protein [Streptomyces sp. SM11]|uniref:ATP-binding cassette domain-containing protein n=1 Tax=Streptomyces sp. SM11 TaxID=565557 RepID=UPI000CD4B12E|nr:ATP-binding cassette domain-containing protein [Streptomyces sp. SM11]
MTAPLLTVEALEVSYPGRGFRARPTRILHGVSLDIGPGETLGVVGESGSGKTTLGRAILGLAPVTGGDIRFRDRSIARLDRRSRRALATDIQAVFQDPHGSLNPVQTIGDILTEPLTATRATDPAKAHARVAELLERVGLSRDSARRLPREFSGGQRQRIAIARALALEPALIVCDEPVSALGLTTQARVLELLKEIQQASGVAYLFISHDLAVVRHLSHRVAVLYRGDIVEEGDGAQVTTEPQHPYTQRLLMASPLPDPDLQAQRRAQRRQLTPATE